jgi:hypothetical protein
VAAEDAGIAAHAALEISRFHQVWAADLFSVVNPARPEIITGKRAQFVDHGNAGRRTVKIGGFGAKVLVGGLDGFQYGLAEFLRPRYPDAAMAANGNGFQILGAHDGPGPPAAGRVVVIGHDGGKKHPVFSGRSYTGHLNVRIPQGMLNSPGGFADIFAPQFRRIPNFHLPIPDQ